MKKILLIDDDELVRYSLGRYLRREGFTVVELENGTKALRTIAIEEPDLVLTDLIMPDMDGIEVTMQVHKEYPNLPLIAMSGGGRQVDASHLEYAEAFGASVILEKPFDEQVLIDHIHRLTQG